MGHQDSAYPCGFLFRICFARSIYRGILCRPFVPKLQEEEISIIPITMTITMTFTKRITMTITSTMRRAVREGVPRRSEACTLPESLGLWP